uniref:cysteine desulfurase n=1 Tax=Chromera velia CCMP2878 TaxID=1169474 RepID=A0A0G4HM53_9ALVE|mmetsp:Transcript_7314/g.14303  ORF Transcript_7314/g.14303 Transcript_7314/m.14303 type:complete len:421 (+) Transcript_7314:131-1393(+)|eukprot:Cvel_7449.t1-p1 / transcript=Cvel_7449.t1 / gene=Cvel_7449 / organism=Chromera_velia_CCMP2878 / gene_product=Cysteine desulfurase, putative / transcript_product=Cysteine desulfurase, putative / location=Cvel_scaffold389:86891-88622(-) / protein_length=420 / sequence_SO=supercontig / SO=protein_coding / is_pseudo=false
MPASPRSLQDVIYLDNNATTPVAPTVREAVSLCLSAHFGNPFSGHVFGKSAAKVLREAREEVRKTLNAHDTEEICFTSGATEALNWAISSCARMVRKKFPHANRIVTSAVEHVAVFKICEALEAEGFETVKVGVDAEGFLDIDCLKEHLDERVCLVTLIHANAEVGAVQPVKEVASAVRARAPNALFHVDASQSVGKIPVDVMDLCVDMMTIAGHKFYAPKGVGALYMRKETALEELPPLLHGGGQEWGRRGGTENVALCAALGEACRLVRECGESSFVCLRESRMSFEQTLLRILSEKCKDAGSPFVVEEMIRFNGPSGREKEHLRLPNTLSISFRGMRGSLMALSLGESLVAVSSGSACHSDCETLSPVLKAMKVPEEWGLGTLRVSTGRGTTVAEAEEAARRVADFVFPRLVGKAAE